MLDSCSTNHHVRLVDHIAQFFALVAGGNVGIYNEFSLQHELGIYLRSQVPPHFKVQFERPAASFSVRPRSYTKKEIDIAIFSLQHNCRLALELKFPRNGQYPEQMFKACQDIAFLEELVDAGFNGGVFVMTADDPLFFRGETRTDLYGCFRAGRPIHGIIRKPTGAKDESVSISGFHTMNWTACGSQMTFASICIGDDSGF